MEERTSARSKGTNRVEVPEARGALDRFKFEVAKMCIRDSCITLPLWNSAFLEIYPYNELLSDIHEGKDITIVGMAAGKDDAVVMLRRMIDDLYHKGKLKDITTYFCGEDK